MTPKPATQTDPNVSVTDVASQRLTAARLDTLVQEVDEQAKKYKTFLHDAERAAAEHTTGGRPSGIYQPPLEATVAVAKHITTQLSHLAESLTNSANILRGHAGQTETDETTAADNFQEL